jgi:hypothetical protein
MYIIVIFIRIPYLFIGVLLSIEEGLKGVEVEVEVKVLKE